MAKRRLNPVQKMPFRCVVAKDSEDKPRFPYEQKSTRMAQIYGDKSDREYFQRQHDYYESHPVANHKSWRQDLEELADDEYDMIPEVEITASSLYCRPYSPSGPHRVDHDGSYTSASLPYGDDFSYGQDRRRIEDRHHHEEDTADQFDDVNVGGRPNQWSAEPPVGQSEINMSPSSSPCGPQPSSQPDHGEDRLSNGRYNAGVRALRSPDTPQPSSQLDLGEDRPLGGHYNAGIRALRSSDTPRPSIQDNTEQAHPSGGRYNAGVRAPRTQDGPSRQGNIRTDRAPEPIDSVFFRLEEDNPALGCSPPASTMDESWSTSSFVISHKTD